MAPQGVAGARDGGSVVVPRHGLAFVLVEEEEEEEEVLRKVG